MTTKYGKNGVGRKVLHLISSGNHFRDKGSVFQNDLHMLNRKGEARFVLGIEEGIQAFLVSGRLGSY